MNWRRLCACGMCLTLADMYRVCYVQSLRAMRYVVMVTDYILTHVILTNT